MVFNRQIGNIHLKSLVFNFKFQKLVSTRASLYFFRKHLQYSKVINVIHTVYNDFSVIRFLTQSHSWRFLFLVCELFLVIDLNKKQLKMTNHFVRQNMYEFYNRIWYKIFNDPLYYIEQEIANEIPQEEMNVIVTGATSGIGKEICKYLGVLVSRGFKFNIIMACRNLEKGYKVAEEIGLKNECVWHLDLSSYRSIREFVWIYDHKYTSLHTLINNAAYLGDDIETMYNVNTLHLAELTNKLIPSLEKNASQARIINVSSVAHLLANTSMENPDIMTAYANSKLCVNLLTDNWNQMFARHANNIVATSVHPGYVATDLYRSNNLNGILKNIKDWTLTAKTPEEGARQVIYAMLCKYPIEGYMANFKEENTYIDVEKFHTKTHSTQISNIISHLYSIDCV